MYERLIEGSVADVPMQETALGAGLVAGGHGWPSQCRRSAAKSFLVLCLSKGGFADDAKLGRLQNRAESQ